MPALFGRQEISTSLAIPLIGVAVSFSMSQTGIVISTLGGIYLLKRESIQNKLCHCRA
ncbi:GRP family sugar transporter [Bacillus sp. SL00103]